MPTKAQLMDAWRADREAHEAEMTRITAQRDRYHDVLERIAGSDVDYWARIAREVLNTK